ncbi:CBO0543 family protein [Bacillus pinisoli]|uniref:CBO0543 family protein n=1 Tax=Bacillus pinisoli TaxID=2901866 RepID=UPI001FF1EF51|nr:CBO0543 family protein [Bacillus pinisoli]
MSQQELFQQIIDRRRELSSLFHQYWEQYSSFHTWQFWVNVSFLLIPLVLLALFIDRKRIFEIGFFGFAIHSISIYLDVFGIHEGYWGYPYQVTSYLASNFALDGSLLPISCMFMYQFTYKKGFIFYTGMIGLAILFSFIVKPLFEKMGLFYLNPTMTYPKLFLYYIGGVVIAVIITKIFHKYSRTSSVT